MAEPASEVAGGKVGGERAKAPFLESFCALVKGTSTAAAWWGSGLILLGVAALYLGEGRWRVPAGVARQWLIPLLKG